MNELSERAQETITYLSAAAQSKTIEARGQSWLNNVVANRAHYSAGNPPLLGLTAFVVAAGPSLKKNAVLLRDVGRFGVVIAVDAGYRYLRETGVVPDYCVTIDADGRMFSMIEGTETRDTTLVAQASACPALVNHWRGPKYFLRATGGSKDLDEKLHAAHRIVRVKKALLPGDTLDPLADIDVEFPGLNEALVCGGNVTTYAHSFALSLLRAVRVVFVGADYAWTDVAEFYANGQHAAMGVERAAGEQIFSHKTAGVGECATNFTLFHLKTWHEELAAAHPGHAVNATEGGILGINKEGRPMAGWEHMPLVEAIKRYTGGRR